MRAEALLVAAVSFAVLMQGAPDLAWYVAYGNDPSFQLSIGQQVVLGKRLFVDVFFHYGPLVAYTSALGLAVHDSLVPETVICALGYAASIGLLFSTARVLVGRLAGVAVAGLALLLLARFYKWYYWLFPLLTVFLVVREPASTGGRARGDALGLVTGVAFLYRIDLGITCLVTAVVGRWLAPRGSGAPLAAAARICVGFLVPVTVWLVVLASYGGTRAVIDYFRSFWDSSIGVSRAMSLPIPGLSASALAHPRAAEAAAGFLYLALPAVAAIVALRTLVLMRRGRASTLDRQHAAIAIGALLVYQQALHRASVFHLLQVLPLFVLTIALGLTRLWRTPGPRRAARRAGVLVASATLATLVLLLRPYWTTDLSGFGENPVAKLRALAGGLDAAPDAPLTETARFVRAHTSDRDTVLLLHYYSQLLFFTGRRNAGYLTHYVPGLLSTAAWQRRNLRQIEHDAPRFVVLVDGLDIDGKPENAIGVYAPILASYVDREYPSVAFRAGPFVVRSRRDG